MFCHSLQLKRSKMEFMCFLFSSLFSLFSFSVFPLCSGHLHLLKCGTSYLTKSLIPPLDNSNEYTVLYSEPRSGSLLLPITGLKWSNTQTVTILRFSNSLERLNPTRSPAFSALPSLSSECLQQEHMIIS